MPNWTRDDGTSDFESRHAAIKDASGRVDPKREERIRREAANAALRRAAELVKLMLGRALDTGRPLTAAFAHSVDLAILAEVKDE